MKFRILDLQNRVTKWSYVKSRQTFELLENFYMNSSVEIPIRLRKILNFTSRYKLKGWTIVLLQKKNSFWVTNLMVRLIFPLSTY